MAAPVRAVGRVPVGASWAQVVPFQVHTSLSAVVPEDCPPNMTSTPRTGSQAIAARRRADGLTVGYTRVQLDPFHTQVSALRTPPAPRPPKSTVCCRTGS